MKKPEGEPPFEALLQSLRPGRAFDLRGYKRPGLMRRVRRRMQALGLDTFPAYARYLEAHREERERLLDALLVNVTTFFRDPPAWDALRREVVPRILAGKPRAEPVRVWSAGCASGEEAYSAAIVLAEAMGEDAFRGRCTIHATDADDEALARARAASYAAEDLAGMEPALRERYFEPANGRRVFRADLRGAVLVGRHDLLRDAPFPRLDLIVCRNTLMYFNAGTQAKVLARFHRALEGEGTGTGYLFLGRAEMILGSAGLFAPVDLRCRIFARAPGTFIAAAAQAARSGGSSMSRIRPKVELHRELVPLAEAAAVAYHVITDKPPPLRDSEALREVRSRVAIALANVAPLLRQENGSAVPLSSREIRERLLDPGAKPDLEGLCVRRLDLLSAVESLKAAHAAFDGTGKPS